MRAVATGAVHMWRMDGLLVAFPVMAYSFTVCMELANSVYHSLSCIIHLHFDPSPPKARTVSAAPCRIALDQLNPELPMRLQ